MDATESNAATSGSQAHSPVVRPARRNASREENSENEKASTSDFIQRQGFAGKGGPYVTIYVGQEKKQYTIPKGILTESSDFFKAAFENGMKETTTQTMDLEETEVDIFEKCLQWLTTKDVTFAGESTKLDFVVPDLRWIRAGTEEEGNAVKEVLLEMTKFLAAADMFLLRPSPAKAVTHRMRKICSKCWCFDYAFQHIIEPVYKLPSTHPARRLISEVAALWYLFEDLRLRDYTLGERNRGVFVFKSELHQVPEFAIDVLDEVMRIISTVQQDVRDPKMGSVTDRLTNLVWTFDLRNGCISG